MAGNELTNIQIYQRKRSFNIGVILFGVIFIYLVITVLAYITGRRVSVYEVREGSILKDTAYTGIVLREEVVVTSDTEGYVNYFAMESTKVGKKTNIYSLSTDKLELDNQGIETGPEPSTKIKHAFAKWNSRTYRISSPDRRNYHLRY